VTQEKGKEHLRERSKLVLGAAQGLGALVVAVLTHRLVRAQTYPDVVAYTHHDDTRQTTIQIVIKNIGNGMARDVQFQPSRPLPRPKS
jgi:mannose/fructose/N-acetylgalactosamine-specific phosphotransferase system component IID